MLGAFPPGTINSELFESGVSVGLTGVSVGITGDIPDDGAAAVVSAIDSADTQLAKNTNTITAKIFILLRMMNIVLRIIVSPHCSPVKQSRKPQLFSVGLFFQARPMNIQPIVISKCQSQCPVYRIRDGESNTLCAVSGRYYTLIRVWYENLSEPLIGLARIQQTETWKPYEF